MGTRSRVLCLDAAAASLAAVSLFLALTGGGRIDIAGVVVSARDATRPAGLLALLLLWRAVALWREPARPGRLQRLTEEAARIGLGAVVLLMAALGLRYLVKACGGLDSHGYVSAATLLTTGRLSVPQPLVAWLPIDHAIDALAPLGYVPSPDGREIVPRFPLGLPLVMALFRILAGTDGPFYVAPVLGAATVILTFGLVNRVGGPLAAGLAAALLAAHPLFVTYAIQPMSDVPATFWVVLATFLLYRERPLPVVAGVAAGMATLTRPPLALAALVLAVVSGRGRPTPSRRFLIGFLPCLVLLIALNSALYGSPTASGYGSPTDLFGLGAIPHNLWTYGKWLLSLHTPVFVLLIVAAWFVADRRFLVVGWLLFIAVAAPYMLYTLFFDDWETLRFLLPGLVFLVMIAAHATTVLLNRYVPAPLAPLLILLLAGGVTAASYAYLEERQVFRLRLLESKYPAVAAWLAENSDGDALVFATQHSGSIRHYSGRTTIRWDLIPPERFAPTVAAITGRRRQMFLVLDGNAERTEFAGYVGAGGTAGVDVEFVDRVQNVSIATVKTLR